MRWCLGAPSSHPSFPLRRPCRQARDKGRSSWLTIPTHIHFRHGAARLHRRPSSARSAATRPRPGASPPPGERQPHRPRQPRRHPLAPLRRGRAHRPHHPRPVGHRVSESPTHAVLEGNNGFGQTVGPQAVEIGIAKAKNAGMAVVTLRHAAHIGRIGEWGEMAARAGLVAIHFVNVENSLLVAPFGGKERRYATNPVCIAIPPMAGRPMLLMDMATSVVAEGKVMVAANGGKEVPEGALIGTDGKLSNDPSTLFRSESTRPPFSARNGKGAIRAMGGAQGLGAEPSCAKSSAACSPAAVPPGRRRVRRGFATACCRSISTRRISASRAGAEGDGIRRLRQDLADRRGRGRSAGARRAGSPQPRQPRGQRHSASSTPGNICAGSPPNSASPFRGKARRHQRLKGPHRETVGRGKGNLARSARSWVAPRPVRLPVYFCFLAKDFRHG